MAMIIKAHGRKTLHKGQIEPKKCPMSSGQSHQWAATFVPLLSRKALYQLLPIGWVSEIAQTPTIHLHSIFQFNISYWILLNLFLKVKVTQSILTLCNPWTIQSMEFSRPEYCSG